MKYIRILLIAITLLLFITISSYAKTGTVTSEGVNFRKEASFDSEVIGFLNTNDKIDILDTIEVERDDDGVIKKNIWHRINFNGTEGYVISTFVVDGDVEISTPTPTVAPTGVGVGVPDDPSQPTPTVAPTVTPTPTVAPTPTIAPTVAPTPTVTITPETAPAETATPTIETTPSPTNEPIPEITLGKKVILANSNIHIVPVINSSVVYTVSSQAIVTVNTIVNKWANITYNEAQTGWVRISNLEEAIIDEV
jgi:uncharacterized protein YgiM (DUF1202 family)